MKQLIIGILLFALLTLSVSGHTIERQSVIKNAGEYNIQFFTEPEYPLAQRPTHLDFEIWDNTGKTLDGINVEIEIITPKRSFMIGTREGHGHYETEQVFETYGEYNIVPYINGKRLDTSFVLFVDSFQRGGWWKVSVIAFFLFILAYFMYQDCTKRNMRKQIKKKSIWEHWALIILEVLFALCAASVVLYSMLGIFSFGFLSYRFFNIVLSVVIVFYIIWALLNSRKHIYAFITFFSLFHFIDGIIIQFWYKTIIHSLILITMVWIYYKKRRLQHG